MQRSKIEKNDLYVQALQICSRERCAARHVLARNRDVKYSTCPEWPVGDVSVSV